MRRVILALALLWPLVAVAQHAGEFSGANADKALEGERDKDGDRVQVNLKGVSATPTPAAANRCIVQCDAVADQLVASVNGGPYQLLAGGSGNGCVCESSGLNSTATGENASCGGDNSVCLGEDAATSINGDNTVCIGMGATCDGQRAVMIGRGLTDLGGSEDSILLGYNFIVNGINDAICLATTTCDASDNTAVLGSDTSQIDTLYIGKGQFSASPSAVSFSGTKGQGTDITGGHVNILPGAGTGNASTGDIRFFHCPPGVSGTGVNACGTSAHFNGDDGNLHFPDDIGLVFGSGDDATLIHDSGLGVLRLMGNFDVHGQFEFYDGGTSLSGVNILLSVWDPLTMTGINDVLAGIVMNSTVTWNENGGTIALFKNGMVHSNQTGEARTWDTLGIFIDDGIVDVDANSTVQSYASFNASPTFSASAGTLTATNVWGASLGIQVDAGGSISTRTGLSIGSNTGAGTIVDDRGIIIDRLTGTNIVGLVNESPTVYPAVAQNLSGASGVIGSDGTVYALTNSTGATLTLTSTPTIADPDDVGVTGGKARFLILVNVDSADDIVIQDEGTLAGSNVRLNGGTNKTLGPNDTLTLYYSQDKSEWLELASSNN